MRIPLIGVALIAAAAVNANAQTARATLAPASKIWIEGTSNVHDWKMEATQIDAQIELDPAGLASAPAAMITSVKLTIPAKTLKSEHDTMAENARKALKADKNPNIIYTLVKVEAVTAEAKDGFTLKAAGTLNLAGVENAVTAEIVAIRLADGTIKATGTVPVKMTAFQVKPPTAMLGAIRCGDEVKVKFDLVVGPKVIAAVDK
jgi:polyisoprenoid-binding protein YceI